MAPDARKKTGEVNSYTVPSPRPVSPPKLQPFSCFRSVSSISSFAMLSHPVSLPSHSPNMSPESIHSVTNHQLSALTTVPIITPPSHSFNITPPSNRFPSSNPHHSCFLSSLSAPVSIPTRVSMTTSSRTSKLLNPSPLRPPVTAVHRLSSWSTPYAFRQRHLSESELSPSLVDMAYTTVQNAFAPSTKSTYAAGVLRFNEFCDAWDVSEDARMPASPTLLAAFVGQVRGRYAGGTIKTWLSGIRAWHVIHQAEWHGDHEWVHNARISASKEGTHFKQPPRAPVSLDHLRLLHNALNLSHSLHAAIWAVATITFFGCRRLGTTHSHTTFTS